MQKQTSLLSFWAAKECNNSLEELETSSGSSSCESISEPKLQLQDRHQIAETTSINKEGIFEHTQVHTTCTAQCCPSLKRIFQPVDKAILDMSASEIRNFQPH